MTARQDLINFTRELNRAINVTFTATRYKFVANEAIKIIQRRTRLGYESEPKSGARRRFPVHSEAYLIKRQLAAGKNFSKKQKQAIREQFDGRVLIKPKQKLANTTTPKKSNLTFTGQLLESIKIISANKKRIVIGPTGRRSGKNEPTNKQLAEYLAEQGRVFLGLRDPEERQLVRLVRRQFGDLVNRRLR